jgi:hypothetical protein
MPYQSEAQRKYLHANEPEIAKEWDMKYPERGQRSATNKDKKKQKSQADHIRKSSASNAGGAAVGGGT